MVILVKNLGNGIKNIIINDPKTYNSLSFATLRSLLNTFKKLDKDNTTKVIILEGAGKGFSAGHNLKEVKNLKKRTKYLKLFNLCSKLMLQIVEGRKPVIAKVHGAAYAAGCQLATSCDLAFKDLTSFKLWPELKPFPAPSKIITLVLLSLSSFLKVFKRDLRVTKDNEL